MPVKLGQHRGVTKDIILEKKECDKALKAGEDQVSQLRKAFQKIDGAQNKMKNDLVEAIKKASSTRESLKNMLDDGASYLKIGKAHAEQLDMLTRKFKDAEQYLDELEREAKAKSKEFKSNPDLAKIHDKAVKKGLSDFNDLQSELQNSRKVAKKPLDWFDRSYASDLKKGLSDYDAALGKVESVCSYMSLKGMRF